MSFQKSANNPMNALSMILNSKLPSVHTTKKGIKPENHRQSLNPQQHHKHQSMMLNTSGGHHDFRLAQTRIDIYRSTNRSPSESKMWNQGKIISRSTSRDQRPFTQLSASQKNLKLHNKLIRTSTSCNNGAQNHTISHFNSQAKNQSK